MAEKAAAVALAEPVGIDIEPSELVLAIGRKADNRLIDDQYVERRIEQAFLFGRLRERQKGVHADRGAQLIGARGVVYAADRVPVGRFVRPDKHSAPLNETAAR